MLTEHWIVRCKSHPNPRPIECDSLNLGLSQPFRPLHTLFQSENSSSTKSILETSCLLLTTLLISLLIEGDSDVISPYSSTTSSNTSAVSPDFLPTIAPPTPPTTPSVISSQKGGELSSGAQADIGIGFVIGGIIYIATKKNWLWRRRLKKKKEADNVLLDWTKAELNADESKKKNESIHEASDHKVHELGDTSHPVEIGNSDRG